MNTATDDVTRWLASWDADRQERARWFGDRVHQADNDIVDALKWRRWTFTVDDDWHHWLCAVAVSRRGVDLVFHKGALLDDPAGILIGEGQYIRSVSYDVAATDEPALRALLREALDRRTDMLPH
jgi:hypothetical protein